MGFLALVGFVFVGLRNASRLSFSMHGHMDEEVSHVSSCVHIAVPYRGTIVAFNHVMDVFFVTKGTRMLFNILHSMMTFRAKF
jgi:hypothetical protein